MSEIGLSAGTIDYQDSGGDGPVIVLLHGLLMDSSLWDETIAVLPSNNRCVAPTLPFGAHRQAMNADADLSLPGISTLVNEFLDALDVHDVTLVGSDTGGALVQLIMCKSAPRISRVVLVSCDAFDNFPPGLTGKTLALAGKLSPTLFGLFMQQMRLRMVRRLPIAFGWLTKRGDSSTRAWMRPIWTQPKIRLDATRMLRATFDDPDLLVKAASALAEFGRPALVVWAANDRVMPLEHGRRLADLLAHGTLVEIEDSYTLIPLDQPTLLAHAIAEFIAISDPSGGVTRPAARP